MAEVGVGVVGEPHGDEAKLVAWSAGPDGGRWSLPTWRRPRRRKKPGGMPRRRSPAWRLGSRTRGGGWARGSRLPGWWRGGTARRRHRLARSGAEPRRAGPSRAGEADGEEQQGKASELGFAEGRCRGYRRARGGGARGGDTAWPARGGGAAACGGGTVAWPPVASAVTRQPVHSVRRLVPLTCGPSGLFEFPMIFNPSNFEIQNGDLPDVQNSPNFA